MKLFILLSLVLSLSSFATLGNCKYQVFDSDYIGIYLEDPDQEDIGSFLMRLAYKGKQVFINAGSFGEDDEDYKLIVKNGEVIVTQHRVDIDIVTEEYIKELGSSISNESPMSDLATEELISQALNPKIRSQIKCRKIEIKNP